MSPPVHRAWEEPLARSVVPLLATVMLAFLASGLGPRHAAAQMVAGRVLDAETLAPIPAMEVRLKDVHGEELARTLSDDDGRFALRAPAPGLFRLAVHRIGYDSTATTGVAVPPDRSLFIDLLVRPLALGLEPIRVAATRPVPYLEAAGFHHRRQRGIGTFFGPEEIERFPGSTPNQLLRRVAGVSLSAAGTLRLRGCRPAVVLDGVFVGSRMLGDLPLEFIEGIELYHGPATVPLHWRDYNTCAAVVVWTKR